MLRGLELALGSAAVAETPWNGRLNVCENAFVCQSTSRREFRGVSARAVLARANTSTRGTVIIHQSCSLGLLHGLVLPMYVMMSKHETVYPIVLV